MNSVRHNIHSRRRFVAAACVAAALGATAGTASAHDVPHGSHGDKKGSYAAHQLREARRATERFRTPEAAEKAGYVLDSECVAEPGAGGMGFHAVNERLMADGRLDPRRPEILVYAKNRRDRLRLVALEYFSGADDRPELFDHPFDGPFTGPGESSVFLLHAWVHKRNPAGVFAPFNPRVTC